MRQPPTSRITAIWNSKDSHETLHLYCCHRRYIYRFAVVFDTFPRSTVSEIWRSVSLLLSQVLMECLADGSFACDISTWFSDSEPYRDLFMTPSMQVSDLLAIAPTDDNIRFNAGDMALEKGT